MTKPIMSSAFRCCFSLFVACVFCVSVSGVAAAAAAQDAKPQQKQDIVVPSSNATTPQRVTTLVSIERDGTDTLGAALSLQVQDIFNKGTLCTLTTKEEPQLRLVLATRPEFETRPQVGSAYSAIWLYYEGPRSFATYLTSEVGVVTPENTAAIATSLAEKTVGLSVRYAFLFGKK